MSCLSSEDPYNWLEVEPLGEPSGIEYRKSRKWMAQKLQKRKKKGEKKKAHNEHNTLLF